jgi:hypothetical protein
LTAQNQVVKEDRTMLFEVLPVHPSPFTNGALFLGGRGKNRNIIIANAFIPKGANAL